MAVMLRNGSHGDVHTARPFCNQCSRIHKHVGVFDDPNRIAALPLSLLSSTAGFPIKKNPSYYYTRKHHTDTTHEMKKAFA